jgi:hypothetical protein
LALRANLVASREQRSRVGARLCLKISMGIGLWVTGIGKCCGLWPLVHASHPSWSPFQFMPNPLSFWSVIRTQYSTQPSSPTFALLHRP